MTKYLQFTGGEIIADVLALMPEAHEILQAHNVSCAGCYISAYETLEQGITAHYDHPTYLAILQDLNEAAQELEISAQKAIKKEVTLSPFAAEKVLEFQELKDQEGYGFKVEVLQENNGDPSYFLDFQEKPDKGDIILKSENIKLFLDPESYRFLLGCEINFVEEGDEIGFRVDRMQA